MISAVLFDFDGVIADTERLHLRAFQDVLADIGVRLSAEEYAARYLGLEDVAVLRAVFRDTRLDLDDARLRGLLASKTRRYARLISETEVLYPGVAERVREWCRVVPLAIASGALREEIEQILGRANLLECFSAIVTARDVARGKPAPDPYLAALDRLNARRPGVGSGIERRHPIRAADCVVIEDAVPGIEAAKAAGMRVVAVMTNHGADRLGAADLVVPSVASLTLEALAGLA